MRVRWTDPAASDLEEIVAYISHDSVEAAHRTAKRIYDEAQSLRTMSRRGHRGREDAELEWNVQGTNYIISYEIHREAVHILRIWHGARDRVM